MNTIPDGAHVDTVKAYNRCAMAFLDRFTKVGVQTEHLIRALDMAGYGEDTWDDATVLEMACGPGREAGWLLPRVGGYVGFDASCKFIEIARDLFPDNADLFRLDSFFSFYESPMEGSFDVVFSFAGLVHDDAVRTTAGLAWRALRSGGIFYLTTKLPTSPGLGSGAALLEDQFGVRKFWYFTGSDLGMTIGGVDGLSLHYSKQFTDPYDNPWIAMAFKKD
jgi:SAM-dependent methyltransferase